MMRTIPRGGLPGFEREIRRLGQLRRRVLQLLPSARLYPAGGNYHETRLDLFGAASLGGASCAVRGDGSLLKDTNAASIASGIVSQSLAREAVQVPDGEEEMPLEARAAAHHAAWGSELLQKAVRGDDGTTTCHPAATAGNQLLAAAILAPERADYWRSLERLLAHDVAPLAGSHEATAFHANPLSYLLLA